MTSRRKQREITLQSLYMYEQQKRELSIDDLLRFDWLHGKIEDREFASEILGYAILHINEIDAKIKKYIPQEKRLDSLEILDLCILRTAVAEFFYVSTDRKIVIDEAIRLSKKFSSASSYKIINGLLDSITVVDKLMGKENFDGR